MDEEKINKLIEVTVLDEDFLEGCTLIIEKLYFRKYRIYKKYAISKGFKKCKYNKFIFEKYYYNHNTIRGVEKLEVL